MEESISVRIPKEEMYEINRISEYENSNKSKILREILAKGIKQKKLEIALSKFQNSEASASKAAEIAGIPLTSFLDVLHKKGISFHYDLDDLKDDFKDII